ncbi:uncharacterized protein LOC127807562 [Diospyros lotus]|uniref:uncharacterized protein LOC127807562 n=1 Tax=Diospyros lotus TaxID=55363 RepID=UPI00225613FA|nr:uncharacterized protein LOC127807562 [Diospyros lotus]
MAEQRQGFLSRLPWRSRARTPRRTPQVPAAVESSSETPTQPTTRAPRAQRSPFRPAGVASPPSQSQASTRTESQPSNENAQSRVTSLPARPSRATRQSRAASQAPSPSRTAKQSQAATEPPLSPSQVIPKLQAAPQPLPMSPLASKTQPESHEASEAQSPSKTQEVHESPPGSTNPPLPVSQEEPKLESLEPASQELQTKAEQVSTVVEPKAPQSSDRNPEETVEKNEIIHELGNKEKIDDVTREFRQRTAASGSSVPNKMHQNAAFDAEQKQLEKEVIHTRTGPLTNFSSNGKQTKTVIPNLKDRERPPQNKEIRDDISEFVHKMVTEQPKDPMADKLVVMTLAGENRGASMQLGSKSADRDGTVYIHRGYKINQDVSTEATTDREVNFERRESNYSKHEEDQMPEKYINNNVQSINNSIVLDGFITEGSPGVQIVRSCNHMEPLSPAKKTESIGTHRAEFNVTPAQKLTYEPRVRRRCLRGLFMEPSDSDSDNPEKPPRHGCRYCKEKNEENQIDIF